VGREKTVISRKRVGQKTKIENESGIPDDTITRFAQASVDETDDDSSAANFPNTAIERPSIDVTDEDESSQSDNDDSESPIEDVLLS
jgi:hypothetical protein